MKRGAVSAIVLAVAVGIALALRLSREDGEARPTVVDERVGVLGGVHFGETQATVRARLGAESDDRDGFFPAGAHYTGPNVIRTPKTDRGSRVPPSELHYGDAAYLVSPTVGVFSMATIARGARTRAGVGIGDDLALVRRSYDRVVCGETVAGEPLFGGEPPTYPWCRALVGEIRVFFGDDPIDSITLTSYGR